MNSLRTAIFLPSLLVASVSFLVASCTGDYSESAIAPSVDTAAELDKIMELDRQWSAAVGAGDLDFIANVHATDAIQLPNQAPPITGKAAIREAWDGVLQTEGLEIDWQPTQGAVAASGDLAYTIGTVSVTPPGATEAMSEKYAVIWKKENGEWKVAVDIFNSNQE